MNLEQLVEAARKAIAAGNLEDAKKYTEQAKALREIESLLPPTDTPELVAMKARLADYDAKWAKLEGEPARNKAGHLVVTEDEGDKKAKMPFATLGEQLKAIALAYKNPHGGVDERLLSQAQKAVLGNNEGQSSDGGFLVQQDFTSEIMSLSHDVAVVSNLCRRIPIGANANGLKINLVAESSRANGSRFGGARGYWVAEGGTITASQPTLRQVEWNLHKLGVLMYASDEILQDATALGAVMQMAASEEVAFMLDDSIINGSGAGQPTGIVTAVATISVAKETGQAAASLVYPNIQKMWARMHAPSRAKAVWFINQDVEPALNSMDFPVGTGGVPVFLPPGGASAAPYSTLYGRPIVPTEFNATLGTVGDIILADMNQYLLVDKGGIQGASSIHVQFLTDQTAFRWIYRVDGKSLWHSALTPKNGSNTLSPFVTLATRA
jgi:HK97 family phage major capsid protein